MQIVNLFVCALFAAASVIIAAPSLLKEDYEAAARRQITKWQHQYDNYIEATLKTSKSGCTEENIVYRREWGSMSKESRKQYIEAVQCLQKKPPLSSNTDVPGARSRFDDFSAVHIAQAPFIHFNGLFWHFHRYSLWLYENALRDECGYQGTQPYWDWTIDYLDPTKSSVFNGSPYSMGSDGAWVPHGVLNVSAFGITFPITPGRGGGCVDQGPFAHHTINLGPVAFPPPGPKAGLGYNPRCLTRDLHTEWTNHTKPSDIVRLFNHCGDLGCFDADAEGLIGAHTSGHFAVGGIMMDPWASAQDPVFFLHHANVDRIWSVWQGSAPGNRTDQVYGTQTAVNTNVDPLSGDPHPDPPSADVTLDTTMDFGLLSPKKKKVRDMVSTIDGPFCYAYI